MKHRPVPPFPPILCGLGLRPDLEVGAGSQLGKRGSRMAGAGHAASARLRASDPKVQEQGGLTMKQVRRGVAGTAIGIALLAAASALPAAAADITLTVGKANATSDAIIPVNVGDQLGIFKK